MRRTKFWNLLGVIVGVAIIIMGIIIAFTPATSYSTQSSEKVSFGGDYYTYQYEATANAVKNTAVTANNLREIAEKLALYAGLMFIVAGVLVALCYLKKYFLEEDYYEDYDFDPSEILEMTPEELEAMLSEEAEETLSEEAAIDEAPEEAVDEAASEEAASEEETIQE